MIAEQLGGCAPRAEREIWLGRNETCNRLHGSLRRQVARQVWLVPSSLRTVELYECVYLPVHANTTAGRASDDNILNVSAAMLEELG